MENSLALTSASPLRPVTDAAAPRWLTIDQASRLSGLDEGTLRRKCGNIWMGEGKARLSKEQDKRSYWEIRSDADPAFAVEASSTSLLTNAIDLRQYPKKLIDQALARKVILDRWQKHLGAATVMGISRDAATDAFLSLLGRESGEVRERRTLYNWVGKFKTEGLIGLMDGRARRTVEDKLAAGKDGDPFLEEIKALWLHQNKPGVSLCHKMALLRASQMGWQVCSLRHAQRFIDRFEKDNIPTVALLRGGPEEFNNIAARFLNRGYDLIDSNELWNGDDHLCDVMVIVGHRVDTKTGEQRPLYGRPWITAIQDVRSRKIVAWKIAYYAGRGPSTNSIIEVLDYAFASHHVPQCFYSDNGKTYDCQMLTGETKKMRWERRKLKIERNDALLGGIYAAFKIEHIHAWPWHGQSKPIERFFGTMEGRFGKTFDTYCGNSPENRPEHLPDMLAKGAGPTLAEFAEQFAAWVEADYHQRIHTGDAMDCTPDHAWRANLHVIRDATDEERSLMLQPHTEPLRVGQNGIVHKGIWYGQNELADHMGKWVTLTVDRARVDQVRVWSASAPARSDKGRKVPVARGPDDGRFLCVAKSNLRISPLATSEHLSAAISEQKKVNKAMRDAARLRPRLHMDRTDLLNEAAYEDAKRLPAPAGGEDPTPPTISPIRSGLEAQLPAIRAGNEVPLKKAVGDGTPSPSGLFQYTPRCDDEGSSSGFIYHGRSENDP